MQIKWIFEDLEPGQIRGPVATSEDGNYQIVFDIYYRNSIYYFYYYLYRNSDCIYAFEVERDSNFDFSDLLAKCHRKIERWENKINPYICGNCNLLIFKDYRHRDGMCKLVRIHRNFDDPCIHEEEQT